MGKLVRLFKKNHECFLAFFLNSLICLLALINFEQIPKNIIQSTAVGMNTRGGGNTVSIRQTRARKYFS